MAELSLITRKGSGEKFEGWWIPLRFDVCCYVVVANFRGVSNETGRIVPSGNCHS
jgi:hypothetical protein